MPSPKEKTARIKRLTRLQPVDRAESDVILPSPPSPLRKGKDKGRFPGETGMEITNDLQYLRLDPNLPLMYTCRLHGLGTAQLERIWKVPQDRHNLLVCCIFQWFQQFSGCSHLTVWGVSLMKSAGVAFPRLATMCILLSIVVGMVLAQRFVYKTPRRSLVVGGGIALSLILAIQLALHISPTMLVSEYEQSIGNQLALVLTTGALYLVYIMTWSMAGQILPIELFRVSQRKIVMTITSINQWLAIFLLVTCAPWIFKVWELVGFQALLFCSTTVGTILAYFVLPESLPEASGRESVFVMWKELFIACFSCLCCCIVRSKRRDPLAFKSEVYGYGRPRT